MDFKNVTVREYLSKERSTCELEQVRHFLCEVISKAKEGDDEAFRQLLEIKDIKLFMNHVATKVARKLDNKVPKDVVLVEVQYSLYSFLHTYYKNGQKPTEIQSLITAMYKWLPSKVAVSLTDMVIPKKDENLGVDTDMMLAVHTSMDFDLFIAETLTSEDYRLYRDIYVDCKSNMQISREMHVAEGTIRYKNKQLLCKLRDELTV